MHILKDMFSPVAANTNIFPNYIPVHTKTVPSPWLGKANSPRMPVSIE